MIQDSLASLARPVIVSKFRHDQFFSSHYDITTYLIKVDVIVRNAVYNSAQLRGSATGSIMTGEACADMAGIKVMLLLAAQKPDFDYDLFFRTFAHQGTGDGSLSLFFAAFLVFDGGDRQEGRLTAERKPAVRRE